MRTVCIPLTITYVESKLSAAEKRPQFRVYLDGRFKRQPVELELKEGDRTHITIEGRISAQQKSIPPTTAIGIASFAWRLNDANLGGAPCLLDTGTNHLMLGDILNGDADNVFERNVPMLMHTADNFQKHMLHITIDRQHVDLGGLRLENTMINMPLVGNAMMEYIQSTLQQEQQMPDAIPGTEKIRIPYDFSESGVEMTGGIPLPAAAYALSEVPEANDEFFYNAFETVMQRDDMNPQDFDSLNAMGQARTMALVLCYMPQYLDYVSDTIDRNQRFEQYRQRLVEAYENFGDSLATESGDCEDLGSGILQVYNALVEHRFTNTRHPYTPYLQRIQYIAKQYMGALSLDVVNGAKVQDENAPKGAHMNDNLIPIQKVRTYLQSTIEGTQIDAQLPWPSDLDTKTEYPFLVGEGTGMYEVLGYDCGETHLKAVGYVYSLPSLRAFKKPILHRRNETSSFFVGSLVGITDYFFRRGQRYGSFWYTTNQARGARYTDMIASSKSVGIKMHTPLSVSVMAATREATYLRVPPRPLILTQKKTTHNQHPILDQVCAAIRDLNRPADLSTIENIVPIYVRSYQVTQELGQQLISDFTRATRIWKVKYNVEHVTDRVWGYRVQVFVQTFSKK